jgi:hypothetical protein
MLFASACHGADSGYTETDKIQLLFYGGIGEVDDKEKIMSSPQQVLLSIKMDIEKVTHVELNDISADDSCHFDGILPSPSTMASFTFNPKANIKQVDFRIKLPCAAYSGQLYVMVKVTSLEGHYFMKKKLPALIDVRGNGYP